jgi:hypothetical protein
LRVQEALRFFGLQFGRLETFEQPGNLIWVGRIDETDGLERQKRFLFRRDARCLRRLPRDQPQKIRAFYVKLDEGRFYFLEDVRALLNEIHDQCEGFLGHLAERENLNLDNNEQRSRRGDPASGRKTPDLRVAGRIS